MSAILSRESETARRYRNTRRLILIGWTNTSNMAKKIKRYILTLTDKRTCKSVSMQIPEAIFTDTDNFNAGETARILFELLMMKSGEALTAEGVGGRNL